MLSHWWAATSNSKGSDRVLLQDLQTGPSKQNWQDQEIENAEKSKNIFKKLIGRICFASLHDLAVCVYVAVSASVII